MNRPRLVLADDHAMLLDALHALLATDFDVVATVKDGHELLNVCDRLMPDVAIIDICMPRLNGLDAGRQLRARHSGIKLIYLTMNADPAVASQALKMGACGYVLKMSAASELRRAIDEALRGRSYITPLIRRDVVTSLAQHECEGPVLTSRQREVLQLIAEGRSMKEVGAVLNVTPRTVAFHKYRMMEQLRFRSTAELVQFAVRQGMVG